MEDCRCGQTLETEAEAEHGMCEGCAIDLYEIQQAKREQAYLENDDSFPEVTE